MKRVLPDGPVSTWVWSFMDFASSDPMFNAMSVLPDRTLVAAVVASTFSILMAS